MDFGVIKEIGSAFLVGSTGLLIIEAYFYFCTGWAVTGFFRLPIGLDPVSAAGQNDAEAAAESHGNIQIGAFVGIATIAGLLCQSAFQGLIDNANFPVISIPSFVSGTLCTPQGMEFGCLPSSLSKEGIRASVFYERKRQTTDDNVGSIPAAIMIKETNLAYEYIKSGILKKYCSDFQVSLLPQQLAKSLADVEKDTGKGDSECIKHLYYIAKNWSSRQPTLYDELMRIHAKIEFERSFSLVTISLLPWAALFLINTAALRYSLMFKGEPPKASCQNRWDRFVRQCHPDQQMPTLLRVSLVVILLMLGVACMWGETNWLLHPATGSKPVFASWTFALIASALVTLVLIAVIRSNRTRKQGWLRSCGLVSLLVLFLLIGHLLGFYAYISDEQEYAKRSFGYFESHEVLDKPPALPGATDPITGLGDDGPKQGPYNE